VRWLLSILSKVSPELEEGEKIG